MKRSPVRNRAYDKITSGRVKEIQWQSLFGPTVGAGRDLTDVRRRALSEPIASGRARPRRGLSDVRACAADCVTGGRE